MVLTFEDNRLRLSRCGGITERTAGMLKSDGPPRSPEEEQEAFEQAVVEVRFEG